MANKMENKLEFIFEKIDSSEDALERNLLRDKLINELSRIEKIANEMPYEKARIFLGKFSFEIAKANFFYGAGNNLYPNKNYSPK